jgi:phage/plasmid-associated DNA primase
VDRWEIIPFPRYVGDRVDRSLEPRLQSAESLQGIAAGAVAALRILMADEAFKVTDSSRLAKEDFARKSNPLYQYIEDRCKVAP